ncbi:MAG: DUF4177 domain-containing protein [Chloroflexi bacterium]|nr:DUF4177 domain-containing protein [Chloroflexota bacterium]
MSRWEYKIIKQAWTGADREIAALEEMLNRYGNGGWDLVDVTWDPANKLTVATLKRRAGGDRLLPKRGPEMA